MILREHRAHDKSLQLDFVSLSTQFMGQVRVFQEFFLTSCIVQGLFLVERNCYVDNNDFLLLPVEDDQVRSERWVGFRKLAIDAGAGTRREGLSKPVKNLIMSFGDMWVVRFTVVENMGKSLVLITTFPASFVPLRIKLEGPVEGEEVKAGLVNEAPVLESGKLSITDEKVVLRVEARHG